ncbi:MAG TPA: penicillin acylase family protein [Bryobacteraceae bacterium]|nr:penicillin acylase family protein [Bryobacteraceae bacterium]
MRLNRLLKYINIVIAVLIVLAGAGVYWLSWRPLPQTSGTIRAGVARRVSVFFDALGEPHIAAADQEDLLFAQGYLTAQERMWQMDSLRRLAGGDLSEIVGAVALESDEKVRKLRMRRVAEDAYQTMPVGDRAALAAYARGVNAYLDSHRGRMPVEFTLLGYDPRPWSVVDSILIGLQMFRDLTTTYPDEILKQNMLAGGDAAKVNFLFPVRSGHELAPGTLLPMGAEEQPGSNAWAIAGSHTASGKPMLSNDMHLEYSIPGVWYLVHLQSPDLNVAGVSLPGEPGVIVGHNARIAWGLTNLHYDVQDLYIEKFDDRSGRYEFRGQAQQARLEREWIRVRNGRPVELVNWVTVHGPMRAEGKRRLALRWVAAEPGIFQFPFLEVDRARNWQEFTRAISRFPGPAQNFVYADVDGNIGYHATGKLPIRRGYQGDVPVDGASGNFEWQGFIPFEQLPASFNPPDGLIVTANQNPFPADYPYAINGNFASHYRSRQIRNMLGGRNGLRPQDTLAVQKDVYSGFHRYLAEAVAAAYDRRGRGRADLAEAAGLLRGWNGQMDKDHAEPLIISLVFQHFRRAVVEAASPGKGAEYETHMSPAVIENLLRARPAGWFPDFDDALIRCFADALDEGRRMQGDNVKKWVYGRYLELAINHPIGSRLPLVAGYFDIGPVEMSGSSTSVKQTTRRLGPSMRMNVDLGDWDRSLMNLPIGESGHVLSRHYKDQWDAYYNATSFPMQFNKIDVKSVLELVPE